MIQTELSEPKQNQANTFSEDGCGGLRMGVGVEMKLNFEEVLRSREKRWATTTTTAAATRVVENLRQPRNEIAGDFPSD